MQHQIIIKSFFIIIINIEKYYKNKVINMLSRKPSLEKEQESSAIKEVETLQ
jgi:hypothetical protein